MISLDYSVFARIVMRKLICFSMSASLILSAPLADACTAFSFIDSGRPIVAKNYDWLPLHGHGAIFANKRGVAKRAQTLRTENSLQWVSKYGSVTFTQMGREFPFSGMNEAGLVVEILQLWETSHIDEADARPALNEAQFVQYQLDNFATVKEVLQQAVGYRVEQAFIGAHYFVCDKTGDCAVVEFIDGDLFVHSGDKLEHKIMTNSPQAMALAAARGDKKTLAAELSKTPDFVELDPKPQLAQQQEGKQHAHRLMVSTKESLNRFLKGLELLKARNESPLASREFAFDLLSKVTMTKVLRTQWSLVYDPVAGEIEFHTRKAPALKSLRLNEIDFSCDEKATAFWSEMNLQEGGDANAQLKPYDPIANKALVDENWWLLGSHLRSLASTYPDRMTHCISPLIK